jgi:centrosomal CEP192-like protein
VAIVGLATQVRLAISGSSPTVTPTPTASRTLVPATLNARPKSISFPAQVVGHPSKAASVTVINKIGNAPVTLLPPTVSGGFVVTSSDCPQTLQPGASCTIEVASVPAAKGKQTGKLQLNSNAMFGSHTVKLKGRGVPPKLKMSPGSLSFAGVPADAVSLPQSITLRNDNPSTISFAAAPAATPPFNVTANTCTTLAADGGTCTISVEFAPHQPGKFKGTLELRDDAAGSPQHIKLLGISN